MSAMTRPDGRTYRPRKPGLRARGWENPDPTGDESAGVVVFGTLDPDEARTLAQESCEAWYGDPDLYQLTEPKASWWRDGFTYAGRAWIEDEQRGAPGVMFTWGERG